MKQCPKPNRMPYLLIYLLPDILSHKEFPILRLGCHPEFEPIAVQRAAASHRTAARQCGLHGPVVAVVVGSFHPPLTILQAWHQANNSLQPIHLSHAADCNKGNSLLKVSETCKTIVPNVLIHSGMALVIRNITVCFEALVSETVKDKLRS
jgi:hypothetical protein